MNNVVTQRFIKCHDKLKEERIIKSSRQFALSLDYLPQSLSEILKGRRDATVELLRKSIDAYKINPVYLYTGEGPMFMSEQDHKDFKVLTIVTDSHNDERIVHVPVQAQAGYAGQVQDPTFIQELPSFTLPDYKYNVGTHRSFDVAGDSMEPTLFEGDKLICSFVEPTLWESSIKDNYVYVIVSLSDVLVKRVENKLKTSRSLVAKSDNNFYDPYEVSLSELREVWYVRARLSPFLPAPENIRNTLQDEMQILKATITEQSKMIAQLNKTIQRIVT